MMLKTAVILLVIGFAAPESISSVVSRILDLAKQSKSKGPLILVVNSGALDSSSSVEVTPLSSVENERPLKNYLSQKSKPRAEYSPKRYPVNYDRDYSAHGYKSSKPKTAVQSPIYKSNYDRDYSAYEYKSSKPKTAVQSPIYKSNYDRDYSAYEYKSSKPKTAVQSPIYKSNYDRDYSAHEYKSSKPKTAVQSPIYKSNYDRDYSAYEDKSSKPKTAVQSPIYKSLLSLRNSLRCGARSECQNDCSETFQGKKKEKCKKTCQVKFECDEEPSDCEDEEECNVSTRGPIPDSSEEKPYGCSKC